jgi:7-cyano-7-deazaguanine synthase
MVVGSCETGQGTAVLCSAGLDSAVLLAAEAVAGRVTPVYVSVGLAWEAAERRALDRLLAHAPFTALPVAPPAHLAVDMNDLYTAGHWAVRGAPPAFDTPDEAVYLAGRNIVLLAKAGVLCERLGLGRIALGTLAGNPFPDATPEFFTTMSRALSLGLAHEVEVVTPFSALHKHEVIRRGVDLGVPFSLTLSCMGPVGDEHCGQCSKCRERRDAFAEAGVPDPATYATRPLR